MPNWWDEDVPADAGGGEGNWWEEDADQTPPKPTWKPTPLSLKEKVQQQATGFLGGLRQEAPNVIKRFGNLGSDIVQGWGDILSGRGSRDTRPAAKKI